MQFVQTGIGSAQGIMVDKRKQTVISREGNFSFVTDHLSNPDYLGRFGKKQKGGVQV